MLQEEGLFYYLVIFFSREVIYYYHFENILIRVTDVKDGNDII